MSNPLVVSISNLAAYTPQETIELVSRSGVKRGNMRPDKVFLSAVSAGCLLGFGCGVSLCAMTAPWYTENAPGLVKLFGAGVFPLGLVLVVLTGADLFTATTMFTLTAVLQGRLPIRKMLLHWFLCFFGNLAGSLFVMSIIMGYGGVFDASPYKEVVISFASKKQISPQVHQIFLKAIVCKMARLPRRIPRHPSQGSRLQGHRHVVAHLCFRCPRPRTRCRQYVLHVSRHLAQDT
ncbi:hypothetical protein FOXG_10116 [Fusarium oxysporum f. sp. lycopersici 4287]|uniref:Formate transporter n=1 Tax=Fusarium oxysporum f. sp. lycopersici (strain 4287 / CBS 123668 / FGSC 9935 / NRRL 34936) TaxID=426428 RepID=A0A0J9WPS9_FUSO4|nr:hypothetical protein FOXG_10116 [Fusarium oxysporum f. sp. lycopersici 4287]KNB09562.1 hypothetical protein FOXG_10116 [Fusarium oxysporum f. sp. lycopersici 4287]